MNPNPSVDLMATLHLEYGKTPLASSKQGKIAPKSTFLPASAIPHPASIAISSASLITRTPRDRALSSFDPASSPATT